MTRKFKVLVTVSLLVNVMFLGLATGMIYRARSDEARKDFQQNLAPETRDLMTRIFQQSFQRMSEITTEAREARENLIHAMTVRDFNVENFDEAVKDLRASQDKIMDIKIQSTKELMRALPETERVKVAHRLASIFDTGRRRQKNLWPKPQWGKDGKIPTGEQQISPVDDTIDQVKEVFGPFRPEPYSKKSVP